MDYKSEKLDQYNIDDIGDVNTRQHARNHVAIDAHIRPLRGGKTRVKVLDLSETGFRMCTPIWIDSDKDIFLTLPGFEAQEANIIWHRQEYYGCTFISPLHPAIFEHISRIFEIRKS